MSAIAIAISHSAPRLQRLHSNIQRNSVASQRRLSDLQPSFGHLNVALQLSTATPLFSTVAQQHSTGFAPQPLNATPLPFNWPKANQPFVGLFNAAGISTAAMQHLSTPQAFQRRFATINCCYAAFQRSSAAFNAAGISTAAPLLSTVAD